MNLKPLKKSAVRPPPHNLRNYSEKPYPEELTCLITTETLTRLLMNQPSRISQMVHQGLIPREDDGRFVLVHAVQAYIKFLRKDYEDEDLVSLSKEKALLTKAQREKVEFELSVTKGKYITVSRVEDEMASMAKAIIGALETLPDVMERDCNLTPDQVYYVENTVNNIRDELYQRLSFDEEDGGDGTITESDGVSESYGDDGDDE